MKKKNKSELISVFTFASVSILSFLAENTIGGIGWLVATLVQLRIYFGIDLYNNEQ
jgi:hypothetical protein